MLIEPYEPELDKLKYIQVPDLVRARGMTVEQRATVIAVGPEAWKDELVPRAKPGDRVMVAAYAGHMVKGTLDGKQYRAINANDIFLRIEAEEVAQKLVANA